MELRSGRRLSSTQQLCSGFTSGMQLRSGRRLCYTNQRSSRCHGPDHISALPDDLLLLILARLRCPATAARTSVLSRRWRDGLWTGHREIVLRGVEFHNLEPTLVRVSLVVSVLEIHVISDGVGHSKTHVNSLLRAAARLDPQKLVFSLPSCVATKFVQIALPCFRRATSIVLDSPLLYLPVPDGVEFPALETLSISAYSVAPLEALLACCPRLRLLKLSVCNDEVMLRSGSLQELVLETNRPGIKRVEIATPELKQLTVSLTSYTNIDISILAPVVEKVSWQCWYRMGSVVLGPWYLDRLRLLHTAERQTGDVPNSLHIHAGIRRLHFRDRETNFTHEIEKHMVAAFSALELHLTTSGHVFGAFVFRVIGMNRMRNDMQRLKAVLLQGSTPVKEEEGCPTNCSCDPENCKTQTMSLTALEDMEIDGFKGEDHEYDFLKLVFVSAPILKTVIVKLSDEDSSSSHGRTDQLYDIFMAYSSVECCVYLSSAEH